jgi:Lrp/AsnC family transcriptional regulator, leucine-responsive regulatory protein
MHEKDEKIIAALKNNARASCKEIAALTGIPITTVHNRIKKLETEGIIAGYRVMIDPKKCGYKLCAIVLVKIDYHPKDMKTDQEKLARGLSQIEGVEETLVVTGETDMVFKIRAKDIKDMNKIIKSIVETPGVSATNTLVVLDPVKDLS